MRIGVIPWAACGLALAMLSPARAQYGYTYRATPYGVSYGSTYYANPYGMNANAPSALAYASYGLPGTYYQPTYQSYMGYAAPGPGLGPGYPVYSITYGSTVVPGGQNGNYVQSPVNNPGNYTYYGAGYAGYAAPTPFYSYGRTTASPTAINYVGYGPPTVSFTSPSVGTQYVGPALNSGVTGAGLGSGTFGYGVGPK
jgi:hypothetical protein